MIHKIIPHMCNFLFTEKVTKKVPNNPNTADEISSIGLILYFDTIHIIH